MADYQHILLAVDFSRNTDLVAQKALALQRAFGARLSLVHVVEFVQVDLSSELILPQELEMDRELLELARERMKELVQRLDLAGAAQHVLQGSTRLEILRLAEEQKVDLIVLGSHGRHGLQLLLGSTANAVLHGAPCDVLAVRIKEA